MTSLVARSLADTAPGFSAAIGYLAWDDLVLGQDLKLAIEYAAATGTYHDGDGPRAIDVHRVRGELGFLSPWRIRYGLVLDRMSALPLPLYAFRAPAGSTRFEFVDAAVAEVDEYRVEALLGYSLLDYLSKYEITYSGFDMDAWASGGLVVTKWPGQRPFPDVSGDHAVSIGLGGALQLGYLWYRRFESMRGAGAYFRLGYGIRILGTGLGNGTPGDRKETEGDEIMILARSTRSSMVRLPQPASRTDQRRDIGQHVGPARPVAGPKGRPGLLSCP